MSVYYNEIDSFCCAWLQNLMDHNLIPFGEIDNRPIQDVNPNDLTSFDQCHFFAGIGGWAYALWLLDFPSDQKVWTGSCPCQPFSKAGLNKGTNDDRHLWPFWSELIRSVKPPVVFGEQVASKLGREWLTCVYDDLEEVGYQSVGADLCTPSVGGLHIRQRLYFANERMEYADIERLERWLSNQQSSSKWTSGQASLENQWSLFDTVHCDGYTRPIEPGVFPLANGVPARVERIRAFGNAIVPQLAAKFVLSFSQAVVDFWRQ